MTLYKYADVLTSTKHCSVQSSDRKYYHNADVCQRNEWAMNFNNNKEANQINRKSLSGIYFYIDWSSWIPLKDIKIQSISVLGVSAKRSILLQILCCTEGIDEIFNLIGLIELRAKITLKKKNDVPFVERLFLNQLWIVWIESRYVYLYMYTRLLALSWDAAQNLRFT